MQPRDESGEIPDSWPSTGFHTVDLSKNIVCGDALVGPGYRGCSTAVTKYPPFDWEKRPTKIGKVVRNGGFDVVVGSPPYISSRNAREYIPKQHEYVKRKYCSMAPGRSDHSFAFMEKAIGLLRKRGRLGFVTSNRFIFNEAGTQLRNCISRDRLLAELVDFGASPITRDAREHSAVVILRKDGSSSFKYVRVLGGTHPQQIVRRLKNSRSGSSNVFRRRVTAREIECSRWSFPAPGHIAALERVRKQTTRLCEIAQCYSGIITGADDVFVVAVLDFDDRGVLVKSRFTSRRYWIEKKRLRPVVSGRDAALVSPLANRLWRIPERGVETRRLRALVWPYDRKGCTLSEDKLREEWPLTYTYLRDNKERLLARNRARLQQIRWYGFLFQWSSRFMRREKLVTGWSNRHMRIGIDRTGTAIFLNGVRAGVLPSKSGPSIEALMGLLCSSTVELYIKAVSAEVNGGYVCRPDILRTLPVVPVTADSRPVYQGIARKVKGVLEVQRKAKPAVVLPRQAQLEGEIDKLVAKLYRVPHK